MNGREGDGVSGEKETGALACMIELTEVKENCGNHKKEQTSV